MKPDRVVIDWNYSGKPDEFFGTGATTAERALVWTVGLFATGILAWVVWTRSIPWTIWQYLVAGLMALDVFGGVVANALNSCKRFYHAPLQPEETGLTRLAKNHLAFTALHVHPLLAALLFGGNWTYGLFWYLALLLSAWMLLQMPLYLRRPTALGLILIAFLLNQYVLPPAWGFEWLIPALFLKLIYGHLVREEPYRP